MDSEIFRFSAGIANKLGAALRSEYRSRQTEIDSISDVFGDPQRWAHNYIEPYCQQFNPADDQDESRSMVRELITSRIQHFLSGGAAVGSPHLLVLADAGMGKTSALVMLKLAAILKFWPSKYEVHLHKLGPETLNRIQGLSRRKSILLLDAMDEDPSGFGRTSERFIEVLAATKNFHRVLITCRTQFFTANDDPFNHRGQAVLGGFTCPTVYLSLFDDDQVRAYLKKRFPKDPNRQLEAERVIRHMSSLRMRPMMLAHIEDLLDSPNQNWTLTSTYIALVSAWLNRERSKMAESRSPKDIPTNEDLLRACIHLARLMSWRGVTTVSPTLLASTLVSDRELRHIEEMDIAGRSLLNKNSAGHFRFAHSSIQEFLVAFAIVKNNPPFVSKAVLKATTLTVDFLTQFLTDLAPEQRKVLPISALEFNTISLVEANWSHTKMREVSLRNSKISRVLFVEANFELAQVEGCGFDGCDFEQASLQRVTVIGCTFQTCQFNETDFVSARIAGTTFEKCVFIGAIFDSAELKSTRFRECRFIDCSLRKTSILESDIERSSFNRTDVDSIASRALTFTNCRFLYSKGPLLTNAAESVRYQGCEVVLTEQELSGSHFE